MTKKRGKSKERPRLVAKVSVEFKDWLRRTAQYETSQLKEVNRGATAPPLAGRLEVTESDIIRRAVERELLKIQADGGPGPNPATPDDPA